MIGRDELTSTRPGDIRNPSMRVNPTVPDSFPVPTYLFFKGDERPGRNDVKVAGQAGKGERKVAFP